MTRTNQESVVSTGRLVTGRWTFLAWPLRKDHTDALLMAQEICGSCAALFLPVFRVRNNIPFLLLRSHNVHIFSLKSPPHFS